MQGRTVEQPSVLRCLDRATALACCSRRPTDGRDGGGINYDPRRARSTHSARSMLGPQQHARQVYLQRRPAWQGSVSHGMGPRPSRQDKAGGASVPGSRPAWLHSTHPWGLFCARWGRRPEKSYRGKRPPAWSVFSNSATPMDSIGPRPPTTPAAGPAGRLSTGRRVSAMGLSGQIGRGRQCSPAKPARVGSWAAAARAARCAEHQGWLIPPCLHCCT